MTEVDKLKERLLHQQVHHEDALDEMRVAYNRQLEQIVTNLRKAQVAQSRTPSKTNVVNYMIQDSIEVATAAIRTKHKR